MRSFKLVFPAIVAALAFPACALESSTDPSSEVAEEESAATESAATAALSFTEFRDPHARVPTTEVRKIFLSQESYTAFFGHAAPPSVNFARHAVAFYGAGTKSTGGYDANILKVTASSSGVTLRVITELVSPGPGCAVTMALTNPHVFVKFAKPVAARHFRFVKHDQTRDCNPGPTCANVRCMAGTHCEMTPVVCITTPCYDVPSCVPDACPGAGQRNPRTGECECTALGKCIAGSTWNADPAFCGCTDPCDSVRCMNGTHCEVVGNAVTCAPNACLQNALCIRGTHFDPTPGVCACVPDEAPPGGCLTDNDCTAYDQYCPSHPCTCEALGHNQRPATCTDPVMCFMQPCAGKKAVCRAGACALVPR